MRHCSPVLHHDTQHNDIQHNDIQHNDIQHNDIQHNGLNCDTQHKCNYHKDSDVIMLKPLCRLLHFYIVMLIVIILIVVRLNVMAPSGAISNFLTMKKPFSNIYWTPSMEQRTLKM